MNKTIEEQLKTRTSTRPCTSHAATPHYNPVHSLQNSINFGEAGQENSFITSPYGKIRRYQSAHGKIKAIKNHLQKLKSQYNSHLQNKTNLTISLNKKNREISETRKQFVKVYEYKKGYIEGVKLQNERTVSVKEHFQETKNKTKTRKMMRELQSMVSKQERQNNRQQLRNKNLLMKKDIKGRLQDNHEAEFLKRKKLYDSRKDEVYLSRLRGKYRDDFIKEKGKKRYWNKMQQQMGIIQDYEDMLKNIEGWEEPLNGYIDQQGFFVTSHK